METRLARAPSPALVLTAIASVQFGSAIATKLFATVGPGGAVLLRLATASLVLTVIGRGGWGRFRGRSRREWLLAAAFGADLAAMNLTFYYALHRLPLGAAVTLEFLGPLAVAVGGSRRRLDLLWALLAAGGILALSQGFGHGLNTTGVILVLCAAACWAGYILINARVGAAFAGSSGLALAMCIATVIALPFGLVDGGTKLITLRSLGLGAAVGMLSSAIPYSLEVEALRRIAVNVFGVLMSLEPGMAALAGLLVLGQGLSVRSVLGILLVSAASVGASLAQPSRAGSVPAKAPELV
ncbi:MAG: EamA family transporter [Solirubrobacteraceae bacterium]